MKKALSGAMVSLVLTAILVAPVSALTLEGVDIPETYTINSQSLALNGAGIRSRFFMDLYVGSLYLPQPGHDAAAIVAADEPQVISLHIISGMITSERMTRATREGFEASTGGKLSAIQEDVDRFMGVFREAIREGDVFDLVYLPGQGVQILKNGELKDTVGGLAFKQALFGIWLSDHPAQKDLKRKMLGLD